MFAQIELVSSGAGLGLLPDFLGDEDERLVRVLDGVYRQKLSYWVIARQETQLSPAAATALRVILAHAGEPASGKVVYGSR